MPYSTFENKGSHLREVDFPWECVDWARNNNCFLPNQSINQSINLVCIKWVELREQVRAFPMDNDIENYP